MSTPSDPILKVMYVEDEKDDRLMFARLIGIAGASLGIYVDVKCVSTIGDIGAGPDCDAILLDLSLANGGTITSIKWIEQWHERMPPIFVLSGHPEHGEDVVRAGAQDFFYKPKFIEDAAFFVSRIQLGIVRHSQRRTA